MDAVRWINTLSKLNFVLEALICIMYLSSFEIKSHISGKNFCDRSSMRGALKEEVFLKYSRGG
ncbi:hypothetical protein BABA_10441 [Neobacillus bataviensis LMG 21833]|uniref:Uncharacterized protein n=1 Tax=Neobacillus bataviensis LMG 21833 TaxID=1117379 RepID=K6DLT0_9BACI|nr:hypothetical protein BABA_10441 [Neobacillus bataviensis LMG 21833]